jgi:endoglucanase
MIRRYFLKNALLAAAFAGADPVWSQGVLMPDERPKNKLPRWRGFNLLEKFTPRNQKPFQLWHFAFMEEHGFNFARLPLSYRCWMRQEDWRGRSEPVISRPEAIDDIDAAIEMGRKHGIHINLNLHRIQGYCVNPPQEPLDLWTNDEALAAAAWQWAFFAKRYKGISNKKLSFDLINEPAGVGEEAYVRVIDRLTAAIRAEDPRRLIVADGLQYGTLPVFGLQGRRLGQSTRGYNPMQVSHHRASWVANGAMTDLPEWPMTIGETQWDKDKLRRDFIEPWRRLQQAGVGIHVGEWGCYRYTPHAVALRWMEDCLALWQEAGWGWSLWNLAGDFGVLNSNRTDVAYESYQTQQLDRKMLELLKKY